MKSIYLVITALLLFIAAGCGSDSTGTGGPIGPGGGGNTGSVSFTTAVVQNANQENFFRFTPDTSMTLFSIVATCTQIQVNETIDGDSTSIFSPTNPLYLGPVQGLATNQQWSFVISGKEGNATGTDYTTTVNFTVP